MNKVSIVKCDEYDYLKVYKSIKESIDLIGGIEKFNLAGKKVLLKPNLLFGEPIEKAITTNPLIIKAVAKIVEEAGGKPVIGDVPGIGTLKSVVDKTSIKELNIPLLEFKDFVQVNFNGFLKTHFISNEALNIDAIINLPKIKTHMLMLLTLSVKNLFGCVSQKRRIELHLMMGISREHFAQMLIDLYQILKPSLTIVDGIIGMEGNGPGSGGTPKKIGVIVAGENCISVDRVISEIIGIGENLYTTQAAIKKGLDGTSLKDIEIVGEKIEDVKLKDFVLPASELSRNMKFGVSIPIFMQNFLRNLGTSKPKIIYSKCKLCKICYNACPPKAIYLEKKLKINYHQCIRCFCCHELCPHNAIDIKKGLLSFIKR